MNQILYNLQHYLYIRNWKWNNLSEFSVLIVYSIVPLFQLHAAENTSLASQFHLQIRNGPQFRDCEFQQRIVSVDSPCFIWNSVLTCGWSAAHSSLVTTLIRLSLSLGNRATVLVRSDCWRFVFVGVTSIFQTWRGNKWAQRQIGVRNSG